MSLSRRCSRVSPRDRHSWRSRLRDERIQAIHDLRALTPPAAHAAPTPKPAPPTPADQ